MVSRNEGGEQMTHRRRQRGRAHTEADLEAFLSSAGGVGRRRCRPFLAANERSRNASLDGVGAAFADVPPDELEREVPRAVSAIRHARKTKQGAAPHEPPARSK